MITEDLAHIECQDNIDQTVSCPNTENEQELLSNIKDSVPMKSPDILTDAKPKKRTKSSQSKKSKSSSKQSSSSISANEMSSRADLINLVVPVKVSSMTAKQEENNGIKSSITVETSYARSNLEVVRLCLRELKWKESSSGTAVDPDIYWHASSFHEGNQNFTYSTGRVNKFPGISDLLRKVHLTRLLNNMRLLFPNQYDFYPKTWFLPEQNQQFKDDIRYIHHLDEEYNRRLTTFIVKPSDGSQGEGIYLLRDPSQIPMTKRPHVVQEYIDRPLLIDGLKFDLRIYVLILNLYPLEIFLYDEGLVRFATIDYKAPSTDNLHQTYMHLTNYSLNRRSVNYKHTMNDQQTDGSKRKLSLVWKQLSQIYGNDKIEQTKVLIRELINKTILAVTPELRVEYEFELPVGRKQTVSCFQIIGFDIILDEELKPILLEVNSNPSLKIDFNKEDEDGKSICQPSPVDEEIKKPLILETLKLALPKKKLDTIARHVKNQANDKVIAERVGKLAQRRVEERNEKLKNARQSRFDIRLNPYFSRPLQSKSIREQQQDQQKESFNSSPTRSENLPQSPDELTPYTVLDPHHLGSIKSVKKTIKRPKKLSTFPDDEDESGAKITPVIETFSSLNIKRSSVLSSSLLSTATRTDATLITSLETFKLIFSPNHHTKYEHLFVLDKIADIYIQLVVMQGGKTMTGGQFRNFASTCKIIDETITSSSIEILYYQMLRKWQQFVSRTTLTGLPFAAFIEGFFVLSQRKFPSAPDLFTSTNHLLNMCSDQLNTSVQVPTSLSIPQSDQYLLYRSSRNNNAVNSSSLNLRANIATLRSSTTAIPLRRSIITTSTNRTSQSCNPPILSATNNSSDRTKQNPLRQSAKSVFPLFFDVL